MSVRNTDSHKRKRVPSDSDSDSNPNIAAPQVPIHEEHYARKVENSAHSCSYMPPQSTTEDEIIYFPEPGPILPQSYEAFQRENSFLLEDHINSIQYSNDPLRDSRFTEKPSYFTNYGSDEAANLEVTSHLAKIDEINPAKSASRQSNYQRFTFVPNTLGSETSHMHVEYKNSAESSSSIPFRNQNYAIKHQKNCQHKFIFTPSQRGESYKQEQVIPLEITTPRNSFSLNGDSEAIGQTFSKEEDTNLESAEETFIKLVPLISNTSWASSLDVLVKVLRKCGDQVPLDDFYNLIYHIDPQEFISSLVAQSITSNKSRSFASKVNGLKLCHFMLQTFKNPGTKAVAFALDAGLSPKLVGSINIHELRRTFLAIKIIFDSLEEVEPHSCEPLPRISVYKVYYILCQKFMLQYPQFCYSPSRKGKLFLGQSQLGKLTKMAFPTLATKRLGKRGDSKYNYVGLVWRESLVDDSILGLLDLELPEIRKHLQNQQAPTQPTVTSLTVNIPQTTSSIDNRNLQSFDFSSVAYGNFSYSYVNSSSRFPCIDCSPRDWDTFPNMAPRLSKWSRETINSSADVLERFGVDIGPLIENFGESIFVGSSDDILIGTIVFAINVLKGNPSAEKALMHLNLALSLLILTSLLASSQEIPTHLQNELHNSLNKCVDVLEPYTPDPSVGNFARSFSRTLKKMAYIREMLIPKIKSEFSYSVVETLAQEMMTQMTQKDEPGEGTILENVIIRGLVLSMNVYNYQLLDGNSKGRDIVLDLANTFILGFSCVIDSLTLLVKPKETEDGQYLAPELPYQFFRLSVKVFHEVCLPNRLFSQLPIPALLYLALHIINELQNKSFQDFGKRNPEVSKETFKTWWFFSSSIQEYVAVVAEIAALSELLSEQ